MSAGIIGKKLGMTQLFMEDGRVLPVTAIQAGPCTIVQVKTRERDGYKAVQLGFGDKRKINNPEKGHFKGLGSFRLLREFRVTEGEEFEVGQTRDVSIFAAGDRVDVTGRSRGMGFAGGVKRHHFRGGPKTHGQSDRHRAPGSIGAGTTPGRVLKGRRMAGHMGNERVTTQNLQVVSVEAEKDLLLIKGAVPGPKNGFVVIQHAVKGQKRGGPIPVVLRPAGASEAAVALAPEEPAVIDEQVEEAAAQEQPIQEPAAEETTPEPVAQAEAPAEEEAAPEEAPEEEPPQEPTAEEQPAEEPVAEEEPEETEPEETKEG